MNHNKIIGNKILWGLLSALFTTTFVALVIGTTYAFKYERMVNTFLGIEQTVNQNEDGIYYKSEFNTPDELVAYQRDLGARIEGEGATLLKNDNQVLPLAKNARVSLFSRSSTDLVYGGTGSGSVSSSSAVNLRDALESNSIRVNKTLWDTYLDMDVERPTFGIDAAILDRVSIAECNTNVFTSGTVVRSFLEYNDAAIIVLSRTGGEGYDLPKDQFDIQNDRTYKGQNGYFALQNDEKDMIRSIKRYFSKTIVLVNSSNALELNWIDDATLKVDSVLWIGAVGQTGIRGVADIIAGKVNPSGHLPDTFAKDSHSAPAMKNNDHFLYQGTIFSGEYDARTNYMIYAEGLYVGYRYYETRYEDTVLGQGQAGSTAGTYYSTAGWRYEEEVDFPFGFGLSYTTFTQTLNPNTIVRDDSLTLSVTVKNTGTVAGKDVVQVYFQSEYKNEDQHYGIEKPSVQLVGFAKTSLLEPDESEQLTIKVDLVDLASYDANHRKTYFLGAGQHYFAIGEDAHDAVNHVLAAKGKTTTNSIMTEDGDATKVYRFLRNSEQIFATSSVTGNEITNQFEGADATTYYGDSITYLSRSNWQETYPVSYENLAYLPAIQAALVSGVEYSRTSYEGEVITGASNGLKLIDLKGKDYDDPLWQSLIDQMSVREIADLIGIGGFGTSAVASIVYPGTKDQDGPAGISGAFYGGKSGMSYPAEVVMAATWNADLMEEMGRSIGEDALATKTVGWYAPGLNTHRTPYGGRNYEYFSEDGFLAGKLAAREIKGVRAKGVVVYAKHFALNDQELHRHGINIYSNEQTIREVYLRPFQYAVVDGRANGIMSAFNRLGPTWAGAHRGLLTEVLRNEWGFHGSVVTDFATSSDWMPLTSGLEAGSTLWLYTDSGKYNNLLVSLVENDKYLLKLAKEAVHELLYSYVDSAAMNGYTSDIDALERQLPWWKPTVIGVDVVTGLLSVASVILLVLKILEGKKKKGGFDIDG